MRGGLPVALERLVRAFMRLPSIGERSATRLAYHLVSKDRDGALLLARALTDALDAVGECERCFSLAANSSLCRVCADPERDASLVCVVEKATDVLPIERLGEYRGIYHVLRGVWSPLRGTATSDLTIEPLLVRVSSDCTREVILAMSATIEGDATALYVARLLSERNILCSRLAQGMPKGGELEFTDDLTLSRAFSGRSSLA